MKQNNVIRPLGKVGVTVEKQPWSEDKDYSKLTLIKNTEGYLYLSIVDVPKGTALTNEEYYLPIVDETFIATYLSNVISFASVKHILDQISELCDLDGVWQQVIDAEIGTTFNFVETPTAPTISGTTEFIDSTNVTITAQSGTSIYYTTDGSTPTEESTPYVSPITLNNSATIKAIAVKDGVTSEVTSKTFTRTKYTIARIFSDNTCTSAPSGEVLSVYIKFYTDIYEDTLDIFDGNKLTLGIIEETSSSPYQANIQWMVDFVSNDADIPEDAPIWAANEGEELVNIETYDVTGDPTIFYSDGTYE